MILQNWQGVYIHIEWRELKACDDVNGNNVMGGDANNRSNVCTSCTFAINGHTLTSSIGWSHLEWLPISCSWKAVVWVVCVSDLVPPPLIDIVMFNCLLECMAGVRDTCMNKGAAVYIHTPYIHTYTRTYIYIAGRL